MYTVSYSRKTCFTLLLGFDFLYKIPDREIRSRHDISILEKYLRKRVFIAVRSAIGLLLESSSCAKQHRRRRGACLWNSPTSRPGVGRRSWKPKPKAFFLETYIFVYVPTDAFLTFGGHRIHLGICFLHLPTRFRVAEC